MDKENLAFHHHFASPYSTESESDDEDLSAFTRRFSRSASLKEPLYTLKEKRVFSGSPESTLGWSGSAPSHGPWSPPFAKNDEDAWNMIYAAAGQVARMKMKMSLSNGGAGAVVNRSNGCLLEGPRGFPHPYCSPRGRCDGDVDGEEFYRQQQSCRYRCVAGSDSVGGGGGGGCGGRPPSFPQTAWPPPQQRLHHRQNQQSPCNVPVMKPVVIGGSGVGCNGGLGGATAAKRERPGTGVFLPRRYCNNPPESRKRQACSPANLPARTIQYSNNTAINGQSQAQARLNVGLVPHYEMLMGRRNAMILAAQQMRSNIHGGVMEAPVNNPEVLLPQEWTY